MPIVAVNQVGQAGLLLDTPPAEIPANAWSRGINARFYNGVVQAMHGDRRLVSDMPQQPTWGMCVRDDIAVNAKWVIAAGDRVYALEGVTLYDITPATPGTPPAVPSWSGDMLGLQIVMHDSQRTPWWWTDANVSTPMVPLPNWPAGMKAYTIRSFKQVLVALDITKADGKHFPTMVKWSHPADPGFAPPTWNEADETKDAGETVLAETSGACKDCVPLRDVNIIYKSDSVYGMTFIGGVFIFRFYKIFGDWGIPHRNCACEYVTGKHFCFTGTDLVIHDGNQVRSVISGKVKSLLKQITVDQLPACFVCTNPGFSEVWFGFRRSLDGMIAADTAIVYNYQEDTVTLRSLPNYRYIGTGRVDPQALPNQTWDGAPQTWDGAGIMWAEYSQVPAFQRLLGMGDMCLNWTDGLQSIHGPLTLERAYVGIPIRADKPPDFSAMKFVRRVWPRFTGQKGVKIQVTFGSADDVGEEIRWRKPMIFQIGITRKFDITLSGKVMAIRLECDAPSDLPFPPWNINDGAFPTGINGVPVPLWRYSGLDIDVKPVGEM